MICCKKTKWLIEKPAPDQKIRIFFLFHPKNPYGKLFSKTIFKSSSKGPFLRKIGKLKIGLNLIEGPMEIMQIGAYSKRSYEETKANLQLRKLWELYSTDWWVGVLWGAGWF